MYGLIIEGLRFMIIENFGQQTLTQVLEITQLSEKSISTHDIYSEHHVPKMLKATCEITGMTPDQIGVLAGRFFVQFLIRHGYGDLMHVMGRRFSDFLKGLDNIHEYFRFRLKEKVKNLNEYLPVDTDSFLKMFPFYIAFNKKMDIIMCGQGLINLMPNIPGQNMTEVFDLQKPCIKFTAEGCLAHANCNFQIESLQPVVKDKVPNGRAENGDEEKKEDAERKDNETLPYVTLRGPIVYLKGCETFLLLATCVVNGLDDMFRMGLFLNDYGDADCNREIIMASIQKSDHLKNLLKSEKQRSQVLTDMTKDISENKKKARQLLMQMMPIEVANTMLRTGRADKCESFECVTIVFCRVVDFAKNSELMNAADIVNLLNSLYILLDELVDLHGVYKVETIGETYMVSAGVPYRNEHDTVIASDWCINVINKVRDCELFFQENKKLQVKIGVFTGSCVGGIVGVQVPRYCLFGDTVNCASRMESTNKVPMTIQIGQRTKDRLEKQAPSKFKIKHRGVLNVKGKGDMKIFEIVGKSGRPRYFKHPPKKHDIDNQKNDTGDDDLEDDHSRASAMSRMSLNWVGDDENIGDSDDDPEETAELNKTIAQTIAQTATSILFTEEYQLQTLPARGNAADEGLLDDILREREELDKEKPRLDLPARPAARGAEARLENIALSRIREEQQRELEKKASTLSLAPSEATSEARADSVVSSASLTTHAPTSVMQQEQEYEVANEIKETPPASEVAEAAPNPEKQPEANTTMANSFKQEPADKIPAEVFGDHNHDDSTDPEELFRKEDRFIEQDKKKEKKKKSEMKTAKKITDSQRKKDPEYKKEKVLPPIKKKEDREREKEKEREKQRQLLESCRCEDIREDPKLKTKVCSIM